MASEPLANSTATLRFRRIALRLWIWIAVLTLGLWIFPIAYRATRLLFVLGFVLVWAGALVLWWRRKTGSVTLIGLVVLVIVLVSLPGRPIQTELLARDYCAGLRVFRGVHYVWGGEGLLGIDCSGLVRQGMIWGQFSYGLRTLNGAPIRNALWLWWNDCSALALRDGANGLTLPRFNADSIPKADPSKLQPGDLAVTADGVHVLAYLGDGRWIEADPTLHKVVEITTPTDNPWFQMSVVFVRWKWLSDPNIR